MSSDAVMSHWAQLREQWQESRLVRLGTWLGALLLGMYLLLAGFDEVDAQLQRNIAQSAELARLQALAKELDWPERGREASGLKEAYDTAVWKDADLALSEAGLQDWLRNVTQRLGLKVREIALVRAEPGVGVAPRLPPGYVELHARVSVELSRTALFALLAEMAAQERRIVVERLSLQSQAQPAIAEIGLRVLARPPGGAP